MDKLKKSALIEKSSQLRKAIEIVGGKSFIEEKLQDDYSVLELLLDNAFLGKENTFSVLDKEYKINELLKIKLEYEKNFLRNKSKAIDSIVYKIKQYDTSLDSEIRKYKKSRVIEEYNNIYDTIEKRYRMDINLLVLSFMNISDVNILSSEEESKYYGEYLLQKKKQIIHGVFSKMGIV